MCQLSLDALCNDPTLRNKVVRTRRRFRSRLYLQRQLKTMYAPVSFFSTGLRKIVRIFSTLTDNTQNVMVIPAADTEWPLENDDIHSDVAFSIST